MLLRANGVDGLVTDAVELEACAEGDVLEGGAAVVGEADIADADDVLGLVEAEVADGVDVAVGSQGGEGGGFEIH